MNAWLAGNDRCLTIFGVVYETGHLRFPPAGQILEIGCAEADWMTPMLAERPDLIITGIDWRAVTHRPVSVIQADVLTHSFPSMSFDAVVGISSIEHIGLGHYDRDPLDRDGDTHTMQRIASWLKPDGWVYLDVPFDDEGGYRVNGTECRIYDSATLERLVVPGLRLAHAWYTRGQVVREVYDAPQRLPHVDGGPSYSYVAIVATREP